MTNPIINELECQLHKVIIYSIDRQDRECPHLSFVKNLKQS